MFSVSCILIPVVAIICAETVIFGESIGITATVTGVVTPPVFQIILCVQHVQTLGTVLGLYIRIVSDGDFSFLSAFGGNQDNTVGTACTVDSC